MSITQGAVNVIAFSFKKSGDDNQGATRSYTNTIPQKQIPWALRPSGAKNRGFSTCEKTTTDTLMSGMRG